jgi:hypothetical protein
LTNKMDPDDYPDVPEPPKRAKRQPSEKQLAALKQGHSALKAMRDAKKAAQSAQKQPEPIPEAAPASPAPVPAPAPAPKQVTWDDFERFKGDLLTTLKPAAAAPSVVPAAPAPAVAEPIKLTGSALLDEIFFRRR